MVRVYFSPFVKGGPGSGEKEGHPYRGNQWDGGIPGRGQGRARPPRRATKFPQRTYYAKNTRNNLLRAHRRQDSDFHSMVKAGQWDKLEQQWMARKPKATKKKNHQKSFDYWKKQYQQHIDDYGAGEPVEFNLVDGVEWYAARSGWEPAKYGPGWESQETSAWLRHDPAISKIFDKRDVDSLTKREKKLNDGMWANATEFDQGRSLFRGTSIQEWEKLGGKVPKPGDQRKMQYFLAMSRKPAISLEFSQPVANDLWASNQMFKRPDLAGKAYQAAMLDREVVHEGWSPYGKQSVLDEGEPNFEVAMAGPYMKINVPKGAEGLNFETIEHETALAPGRLVYSDVLEDVIVRGPYGLVYMPYYAEADYVPWKTKHWSDTRTSKSFELIHVRSTF